MWEEIVETVAGPAGLVMVALVALPGGRKFLRSAAKVAVRAGFEASDGLQTVMTEAKERAQDLIDEVKDEGNSHDKGNRGKNSNKPSSKPNKPNKSSSPI